MQRFDGNGFIFDGTLANCDVCPVRGKHQLARPRQTKNDGIKAPFQLVYGALIGTSTSTALGDYKNVSKNRPVLQADHCLPTLQEGSSSYSASSLLYLNGNRCQQSNRHVLRKQRRWVHRQRY